MRSKNHVVLALNDGPILRESMMQMPVDTSSIEAGYIAFFISTKEVLWLRGVRETIRVFHSFIVMFNDNHAALKVLYNSVVSQ